MAEAFRGKRKLRGADFSEEGVDVEVPDFPGLMVDGKYRVSHAHHSLLDTVALKYCKHEGHIPVLATKKHRQRGFNVTVPGWHYAALLDQVRELRRLQEGLQLKVLELQNEVQK